MRTHTTAYRKKVMARKQEFDPLGGFVGSGPAKRSRRDKKSYDVLGSGKYGDSGSIFDEGNYEPADVTGYSDALLATGGESAEQKPQKHGLFGGLFKKKGKQPAPAPAPEKVQDPGFDSRAYGIEIKDGVMETGIIKRYQEPKDEEPLFDEEPEDDAPLFDDIPEPVAQTEEAAPLPDEVPEDDDAPLFDDIPDTESDLFGEDEPLPQQEELFSEVPAPAEEKPAVKTALNPHVCHLCGKTSWEEWPEFGFSEDEFVPLCKTCTKAVTTLMNHTDPYEEAEIIAEWGQICPGLDKKRAKELVAKGRSISRR